MKEIARLVLVLTVITAAAALILALVEGVTKAPIAAQHRQEMLNAIKAVLPPVDNAPDTDSVSLPIGKNRKGQVVKRVFYRGLKGGALKGVAFQVVAPDGYGGPITIMVGVDPAGHVTGVEILAANETPGLGNRIHQAWFRDQFVGKGLDNADWRVKKDGGQFDQITGATISPRAVVKALKKGLGYFHDHRSQIIAEGGQK
ncbi:MAG TPA: RnfABCDGE type electron transport complex subunit G [Desulfuromonadales bacterium]|nr:RnfABCDGE type electron transport complex subunit G [Desulfuromonadales bacterium]